jgi:hypothetical protein
MQRIWNLKPVERTKRRATSGREGAVEAQKRNRRAGWRCVGDAGADRIRRGNGQQRHWDDGLCEAVDTARGYLLEHRRRSELRTRTVGAVRILRVRMTVPLAGTRGGVAITAGVMSRLHVRAGSVNGLWLGRGRGGGCGARAADAGGEDDQGRQEGDALPGRRRHGRLMLWKSESGVKAIAQPAPRLPLDGNCGGIGRCAGERRCSQIAAAQLVARQMERAARNTLS